MSGKKQKQLQVRDHKNYDYLTITAKVEREAEIIASYATLGWETVSVSEDKKFFDLDVIEFRRPHKIENKDRLQLLQVKLETLLNKYGVLRHKRKAKSAAFGLVGGIFGCIALAAGIALLVTEIAELAAVVTGAIAPADWQTVVKAALPSMGKYMEWRALWHETAQAQARANAAALTPEQRDWTFDLLTGQGAYSADQTNYHWGAYAQISSTAIRAWKALSRAGETTGQLTKIIQGPQESFSDFVARMTEAAERIFGESEQAAPLIEQLIYEQATKECRAAIAPRKNKGLQDWLRVCRELGGPLTNAGLAAAILQSQNRSMSRNDQRTCFNCGKPGHFKKDCRAPDKQGGTLTLCSKCGKPRCRG